MSDQYIGSVAAARGIPYPALFTCVERMFPHHAPCDLNTMITDEEADATVLGLRYSDIENCVLDDNQRFNGMNAFNKNVLVTWYEFGYNFKGGKYDYFPNLATADAFVQELSEKKDNTGALCVDMPTVCVADVAECSYCEPTLVQTNWSRKQEIVIT